MYQYDEFDQSIVEQRSREFRDQVNRRLEGKLSEDEFKPLRLMNGLYLQLHAYMLRVAIPYGVMSSTQMTKLAEIADRFDRGYGHFTTRQNIQFNWPELVDTPDILDELAKVQLHAIQTSGNCIRNITTDPYAGVARDEAVDPRPLCELLRQWSTLHPEFAYLPRKFKFAITGATVDRAAIKVHDVGLQLKKNEAGETVVDIWAGGGQGRTPKIAQLLKGAVPLAALLPYLESLMRVYNQYGRRDNKYKARIKILLSELGLEELQRRVEQEYAASDAASQVDVVAELERIEKRLIKPTYVAASKPAELDYKDPDFRAWVQQNVKPHRETGYAIAVISLKPAGGIPGDATSTQMRAIAQIAQKYSQSEIRVTHRQNIVLPNVPVEDLHAVWSELVEADLGESNLDLPSDIIACPGLDYCALATARSIPIAQSISAKIRSTEISTDSALASTTINISGCINACAHHHVADIGILGLDRAGTENYQITLGGKNDGDARIGQRMGPGLSAAEVTPAVERVIDLYLHTRKSGERFSDTYDRLGKNEFKDAVYGESDRAKIA